MAQHTKIILSDDVDGGPAAQTVLFGLDGAHFEIDLSDAHASQLRGILVKHADAARKVGSLGSTTTFTRVVTDFDPKALRAWASANRIEVSARGRIPAQVVAQYRAAGN